MKTKIIQINQAIEEKRVRLKEKASRYFAAINFPGNNVPEKTHSVSQKNIPPISYILYGLAGVSAIGVLTSDSKFLCLGLTAACAYGGYKLSMPNRTKTDSNPSPITIDKVKNDATSQILDIVKKTSEEWEDFMELQQKKMHEAIAESDMDNNNKNRIISQIYLYEVIDIRISEFYDMISTATSPIEIRQKTEEYKLKLLKAIDSAANQQIAKYKSLL